MLPLLSIYRDNSETLRKKGTYFEKLVIPFLQNDARFAPQFSKIETFSEWAKEQNKSSFDSGIDLVATNSAEYGEGYTAYNANSIIPPQYPKLKLIVLWQHLIAANLPVFRWVSLKTARLIGYGTPRRIHP